LHRVLWTLRVDHEAILLWAWHHGANDWNLGDGWEPRVRMMRITSDQRTKPWGPWGYAHCHFHSRVNIQSPSDLQNGTRKLDLGTSAETSWVLYTDVYSICQSMSQTLGSLNCPTSPTKSGGPRLLGRKILTFVKHHEKSPSFLVQCFFGTPTNDGTTGWQPWTMKTITQRISKSESLITRISNAKITHKITEKSKKKQQRYNLGASKINRPSSTRSAQPYRHWLRSKCSMIKAERFKAEVCCMPTALVQIRSGPC